MWKHGSNCSKTLSQLRGTTQRDNQLALAACGRPTYPHPAVSEGATRRGARCRHRQQSSARQRTGAQALAGREAARRRESAPSRSRRAAQPPGLCSGCRPGAGHHRQTPTANQTEFRRPRPPRAVTTARSGRVDFASGIPGAGGPVGRSPFLLMLLVLLDQTGRRNKGESRFATRCVSPSCGATPAAGPA
jgi:hypothetical protein